MTNLTEKWHKGELPSGWYYVRLIRGEHHIDLYINSKNEWVDCPDNIIDTVVCKVPSYEEWKTAYECVVSENEEITTLKGLLHENRQKMFEAEKNYGFDDSIIDILTPQMEKIDEFLGDKTDVQS